jgi:phage I-like protein
MVCYRYESENFKEISSKWQSRLRASIDSMDATWLSPVLDLMKKPNAP